MKNLIKVCETEEVKKEVSEDEYKTFAEMFLEEPRQIKDIPGIPKMFNTYPCPEPTFCYFRGVPLIDDADIFEVF